MKTLDKLDDVISKGSSKRIMTYNVWNVWCLNAKPPEQAAKYRIEGCAEIILENSPDFVCLQEYDHWYRCHSDGLHYMLISERYAEALPEGIDPNYVWNPIFYDRDKYTLVKNGIVEFKKEGIACYESAHYPDESDTSHFRTLVWAVLEDKTDGKKYVIGSTHYSVVGGDENGVYTHAYEVKLVSDKIKELCAEYEAVSFVCGDYNSPASTLDGGAADSYRLMTVAEFKDTYYLADKITDVGSCGRPGVVVERNYRDLGIDHVMTLSNDISVEAYCILNSERIRRFSDHNPVFVQFS